jgi:hypothetical protein
MRKCESIMRFVITLVCLCFAANTSATDAIPLAKIVATSRQDGLLHVHEVLQDDQENKSTLGYYRKIVERSPGASSVFLVDAESLPDAINASASVFVGARSAATAVPVSKQKAVRGNQWLVAYLGTAHSDPIRWIVKGASIDKSRIRLTYQEPESFIGTADSYPYFYWVPLGKLEHGTYQVELYDADEKVVTLMRRVVVEPSK